MDATTHTGSPSAAQVASTAVLPRGVSVCLRFSRGATEHDALVELDDTPVSGCSVVICTQHRSEELSRLLDSLRGQTRPPDEVVIVDSSCDQATEQLLRSRGDAGWCGERLLYCRVSGNLRGLTRQRNLALRCVRRDVVAFFDDDVVLAPNCLEEMAVVLRDAAAGIAGVSAFIENQTDPPSFLWRLRWWLGIVPALRPGSYSPSGMSVSWNFLAPNTDVVEGDWLCGCSMMYRTAAAREIGFTETFAGYCNGEDLDFSLRMRGCGRLVVAGRARLQHLRASGGRPDAFGMGYWTVRNLYSIHRRCLPQRRWWHAVWFFYAFGLDTLIRAAGLMYPAHLKSRFLFISGRVRFFAEQLGLPPLHHPCL